jgi:RNA polymerase sigma-70 factor (ECF subfamily)
MTNLPTNHKYDEATFEKAKEGDETALNNLLELTQPDIRRYARRTCQSSDIDDAVQESLLLVYRRVGSVKLLGALPAWLFTTVKRECIRISQRNIKHSAEDIEDFQDDFLLSHKSEDALRLDLANAIHSLPEHYRKVVLLRDVAGMSVEEIADTVEETRGCVKSQLHRARILTRELLNLYQEEGYK